MTCRRHFSLFTLPNWSILLSFFERQDTSRCQRMISFTTSHHRMILSFQLVPWDVVNKTTYTPIKPTKKIRRMYEQIISWDATRWRILIWKRNDKRCVILSFRKPIQSKNTCLLAGIVNIWWYSKKKKQLIPNEDLPVFVCYLKSHFLKQHLSWDLTIKYTLLHRFYSYSYCIIKFPMGNWGIPYNNYTSLLFTKDQCRLVLLNFMTCSNALILELLDRFL